MIIVIHLGFVFVIVFVFVIMFVFVIVFVFSIGAICIYLYLSGQQIPAAICFYCRPGLPASKVVIGPAAPSVLTIAMHRRHNRH